MDLSILAYDPGIDAETMAQNRAEKVSLDDLLTRSDFVSVHVPLIEGTRHTIGARELRLMKPQAVLINTSRGPIIDENALVRALRERWIAAAGLDVLESEPIEADHPLLKLDNVVLTPHIASYSDQFVEAFWTHSVRTLIAMAEQQRPLWCVNLHAVASPRGL